ncbi:MAG: hypothetical protein AAF236_01115 [Verrucomicrobiota bacterium]
MDLQFGLAYGPAFLLFFGAVFFFTVRSRWSLAVALVSVLLCFLAILQTVVPDPGRGFLYWIPWMVPLLAVVGFLPSRIWKWSALAACIIVGGVFVFKILSVNPRWSGLEQWLNGSLIIMLPLLLSWYALTRPAKDGEFPAFHFGLFGFVILISMITYLLAGTSKLAFILGGLGILCAAGFLASIIKRSRSDWSTVGFFLIGTAWMSTVYVHYFTEKLPVVVTAFLLFSPGLVSLARISDRSLKWKILLPTALVILGASAAGYVFWLESGTDEYGY